MFGIDFSEFLVIGVVALIVLGPERLPKVARTVGHLLGRMQRYASEVKQQVKNEMDAEDFKNLQSQFQEVKDAASGMENSIRKEAAQTEHHLMTAVDAPAASSLEFVEEPATHEAVPAAPVPVQTPQMELPLAPVEAVPKPTPDNVK
jgi:sec-independent protein translocase protein TatB